MNTKCPSCGHEFTVDTMTTVADAADAATSRAVESMARALAQAREEIKASHSGRKDPRAQAGGRARWLGVSAEERSLRARAMATKRWEKQ